MPEPQEKLSKNSVRKIYTLSITAGVDTFTLQHVIAKVRAVNIGGFVGLFVDLMRSNHIEDRWSYLTLVELYPVTLTNLGTKTVKPHIRYT